MTNSDRPLDRNQALQQILYRNSISLQELSFLAGDASNRKYYRVDSRGLVLMDAPPPESPEKYVQVTQLLLSKDFSVPNIIDSDVENGFVLIEDFGDDTYTKLLKHNTDQEESLYFLAIDTLVELHSEFSIRSLNIRDYTLETHLNEALLFMDWYYLAIKGITPSQEIRQEFSELCQRALQGVWGTVPSSLILRDYHVDNLILLKREGIHACGLLDFQDALWGSITYDIVSLLEDARRDISSTTVEKCWDRYFEAYPHLSRDIILQEAAVISAIRHAKIIGIFTRLYIRDRKPHYLTHIPRVWKLLQKCLDHPTLTDLNFWFQKHFPEAQRLIPPHGSL